MKRLLYIFIAFLIAGFLVFATFTAVSAGIGDGDTTNYVNNGELNIDDSFWTIYDPSGTSGIDTDGVDTYYRLYREPNEASEPYIEQSFYLPPGEVTLDQRFRSSKQLAVTYWLTNTTTGEGICSGITIGSGWHGDTNECEHTGVGGTYLLRYQYTRFEQFQLQFFDLDYVRITVDGAGPTTQPPVITTTIPITATCLIDTGGGVTETVGANMLVNHSFEFNNDSQFIPDDWTLNNPIYAPDMYRDGADALDGSRYLRSNPNQDLDVYQTVYNVPAGNYLYGLHINYDNAGAFSFAVELDFGSGSFPASSVTGTTGYNTYEVTTTVNAGSNDYRINFPVQPSGNVFVDLAYVIPVTETEQGITVYCPAIEEWYEQGGPGGPNVPGITFPQYPAPEGGAAPVVCRNCPRPSGISFDIVGLWIGYLSCIIVNLFSCSLRIWFLNLIQQLTPIYGFFITAFNWLSVNWQAVINWTASNVSSILSWVWGAVLNGWGIVAAWLPENASNVLAVILSALGSIGIVSYALELGSLIVQAGLAIVWDIFEGFREFISILFIVFDAIRGSFTEEPFQIILITSQGQEVNTLPPASLNSPGPSFVKVLWMSLAALASVDYILEVTPVELIIIPIMGGLAFGVILWTGRLWENGLPI